MKSENFWSHNRLYQCREWARYYSKAELQVQHIINQNFRAH